MRSRNFALALICLLSSLNQGCGTYVPPLSDYGDEGLLVQSIVASIHCDVANAVRKFVDQQGKANPVAKEWYEHWGAELALTLAIDDLSSVSPNAVGMPPSPSTALFTLGGNLSGSSEAIRTEKANFFYTMKDLYARAYCTTGIQPLKTAPSLLIANNLRTDDWLFDQVLPYATREANLESSASGYNKQNVLSHEVKFLITTTGSLTPAFRLTRATVNGSGSFISTSRGRTSDLIVTFGPLDPKQKNGALIPQAETVHQVAQIGIANSINQNPGGINLSLFGIPSL